jgi:chromosome segregation ATPase
LQALLEEQRRLRIDAEKSTVPLDYSEVVKDKEALTDQLRLSGEEKKLLQDQVNELIIRNSDISEKFGIVERQNQELAALTANKEEIIASLNDKLSATEKEKESLWIELEEKSVQINSLMESVSVQSVAAQEKEVLVKELEEKSAQIESLRVTIEAQSVVEVEKENLLRELQEKKAQIDALRVAIDAQSLRRDGKRDSVQGAAREKRSIRLPKRIGGRTDRLFESRTRQSDTIRTGAPRRKEHFDRESCRERHGNRKVVGSDGTDDPGVGDENRPKRERRCRELEAPLGISRDGIRPNRATPP